MAFLSERIGALKSCAILIAMALLLACSPSKVKRVAEDGVARFHTQLDAEQYHDIYSNASQEFRNADSEVKMTEFFAAVHRKLGPMRSFNEQSFFINYGTSGTIVTLTYSTQFANGNGMEKFIWRVADQPLLVGYRIDSPTLVTN